MVIEAEAEETTRIRIELTNRIAHYIKTECPCPYLKIIDSI